MCIRDRYMGRRQDDAFENKLNEANLIGLSLTKLSLLQPLEEYKKDPLEMSLEEFKEYYAGLSENYGNQMRTVLRFQGDDEAKEERKEEDGEAIIENESYTSIDRKLKAEAKKKAQEKKEEQKQCEETAKEHLDELYKSIHEKIETKADNE
eukprot:TRINITY_DN7842_c0_g2_i14.p1 TRINITY_DN7842_c0_g2~~TRINITY_DN7842_c0_g2_i14.p1  ORF type:complete len:151 (+),score=77.53 TRINITY_DN7842_c0_g2_i14:73-525(+)